MLIIWTSAEAALIRKVLEPVVSRQRIDLRIESDMTKVPHLNPGDVLLACGGKALAVLTSMGATPKNRTITSLRDRALPMSGGSMFITFDPSIVNKDYARMPEIQWDTQLAIRMALTGSSKPNLGPDLYAGTQAIGA